MSEQQDSEEDLDVPNLDSSSVQAEKRDQTSAERTEETFSETEAKKDVTKTIDVTAREVLDGRWGNGQDRRLRLTQAGYDAREVQARVNQILAERGRR